MEKPISEILQQVQQELPSSNDRSTIKPVFEPKEFRTFFLQVLNGLIVEKSEGVKKLILDDENTKAIELICQYMNREVVFLDSKPEYSFSKGIWLYGNFGSGKTQIMMAYQKVKKILGGRKVGIKTCDQMNQAFQAVDVFTEEPARYLALKKFVDLEDSTERIFDDLGAEEKLIFDYGNKICIMSHILSERYKGFPKVKTHVTTNLSIRQASEDYGGRIDSRCYEMFNFICLGKGAESVDYRKHVSTLSYAQGKNIVE